MNKIMYPLSDALQKIISNEQLRNNIGTKAIGFSVLIQNYFAETDRLDLLTEIFSKEEGVFCINEDEIINDHILIVVKSKFFENEKNILFVLVPSVNSYKTEADDFKEEILSILEMDENKIKLKYEYDLALIKCEIMHQVRKEGVEKGNMN